MLVLLGSKDGTALDCLMGMSGGLQHLLDVLKHSSATELRLSMLTLLDLLAGRPQHEERLLVGGVVPVLLSQYRWEGCCAWWGAHQG